MSKSSSKYNMVNNKIPKTDLLGKILRLFKKHLARFEYFKILIFVVDNFMHFK